MIIRLILMIIFLVSCSGQVIYVPIQTDILEEVVVDSLSTEEAFLKEISDKAFAKEEKRKSITNKILTIAVIYLLVDKFVK